jgi:hypothetical protein
VTGRLDEAIRQLLVEALPLLFTGAAAVQSAIVSDVFTVDPESAEAEAGEVRVDDQVDQLAFDPANAAGPYRLTRPPIPGARRHHLTTPAGDRIALRDSEVAIDPGDPRVFRLQLRADRDLAGVDGVRVLYGAAGVFAKLKGTRTFAVRLETDDPGRLAQAEALAIAAIQLNRARLAEGSADAFAGGDYASQLGIDSLRFEQVTAPSAAARLLHYRAGVAIKVSRALAADEGRPIVRIRTPGRALDPARPVDVDARVDA